MCHFKRLLLTASTKYDDQTLEKNNKDHLNNWKGEGAHKDPHLFCALLGSFNVHTRHAEAYYDVTKTKTKTMMSRKQKQKQ